MLVLPFFIFNDSYSFYFDYAYFKKIREFKIYSCWIGDLCISLLFKRSILALGKTGRIPMILSIWTPIIALGLFTFVGILQINEK